jgi:ribosomal protein L11 methylase PrmA
MLSNGDNILEMSAHKYGNYHKYYSFHPASSRMDIIKSYGLYLKVWVAQGEPAVFSILDVGCNEGDLSMEVLRQARSELPPTVKCVLLGIDIDPSLIELAVTTHSNNQKSDDGPVPTGISA